LLSKQHLAYLEAAKPRQQMPPIRVRVRVRVRVRKPRQQMPQQDSYLKVH